MAGRHIKDTPSRWRRKIAGVPVIGWLIGALSGVALAAFLVAILTEGSITTGDFDVIAQSPGAVTATNGTCDAVLIDPNTGYSITWTDGIAGDTCDVTTRFSTPSANARDAVLEGWTPGPNISGEVTGTLGAACGATMPPSSADFDVVLTFTITATADPGQVIDLTGSSLDWVPAGTEDLSGCT